MTRYAALLAVLLPVTACGARPAGTGAGASSASSPAADPSSATASVTAPGHVMCPDHVVEGQDVVADLDGDGTPDDVTFTQPAGAGCGGGLRAAIGTQRVTASTGTLRPTSMRAVTVPGRKGQLLVVQETHPRGGFQDHLFAYADGKLAELTVDGHALLPFVATDTVGDPSGTFTATCIDGGIAVLRAVPHRPIGIAPAFDVERTDYSLQGTSLVASAVAQVRPNVLAKDLAVLYPGLEKHAVLTQGCG